MFGVLTDGKLHSLVDRRFYLPKYWIDDPVRCDKVGIPQDARTLTSKSEHALDIIHQARAGGMGFAWVGVDEDYDKKPAFL